ncbi:MAG: hypothetical protein KDI33_03515 [Halioglobus sp.]|nr:hypothetical protein [Halioglobus sp.]
MTISRLLSGFLFTLLCSSTFAAAPAIDTPLAELNINERGELTMSGDDFKFIPWRFDAGLGKVQVIQYFGATMSDSKIFEPFTDLLQKSLEPGVVHVTTVLNLDAAMWGTTGFVISELEKNKRLHPDSTMVVDDKGTGLVEWELGEAGSGLVITDDKGVVKYFTRKAMSEDEMAAALALIQANVKS